MESETTQNTKNPTLSATQPDVTEAALKTEVTLKEATVSLSLRAADILERVADAFIAVDRNWHIIYANREACRINQKPLEDFVGKVHWEEWPAAVGTDLERNFRRAMDERVEVHFEHRYVSEPYDVWLENDVYPSEDGINIFYRDITERKRVEQALRRSQEDLHLAVDAAQIGTFYCDYPLDKIVWNETCSKHFFLPSNTDVDFSLFYSLLHPEDREPTRRAIERAQAERIECDVEYRTLVPDGRSRWVNAIGRFHYDSAGEPTRFDGITLDISARKAAEDALRRRVEREHFLAELSVRAQRFSDPEEVIADAVRSVGEFLGVSRCVFADIDIEGDTCTVPPEYRASEFVTSIAGTFPISVFGSFLTDEYEAGRTVTVDDLRLDPVHFPTAFLTAYQAIGVRAFVAVPVLHSAYLVSVIAAHSNVPRHWQPEEVELLQTVVERTWLTVEVMRQQQALVREAEERREAHERTARILESITDAFFTTDRQWRYTYINSQVEAMWGRTREELLGRTVWTAWPQAIGSTFGFQFHRAMNEGVSVSFEEFFPPLDAWLEVRVYPSDDGISVFFRNVSERKTAQAERERLLAEQQKRVEREVLLNDIAKTLRSTLDPELIQETAAALVGEALGADRCYFSVYDPHQDAVRIARDWHRPGLPSVAGEYHLSEYQGYVDALYANGTAIVADSTSLDVPPDVRRVLEGFGIRAFLAVPLLDDGKFVAALAASVGTEPRSWTPEEVSLMEAVLTQTRAAVETARASQRERRFVRDVLASVTEGKLRLCHTASDLPTLLTPVGETISLSKSGGLSELRQVTRGACETAGLSAERGHDMVTAASEAGMNAAVHAGTGLGQVSVSLAGVVQVRVVDQGAGIALENLPQATLSRGFSTKATLGHGLKMMLETADRLYLLTGPGGTTVVLEIERDRPLPAWL